MTDQNEWDIHLQSGDSGQMNKEDPPDLEAIFYAAEPAPAEGVVDPFEGDDKPVTALSEEELLEEYQELEKNKAMLTPTNAEAAGYKIRGQVYVDLEDAVAAIYGRGLMAFSVVVRSVSTVKVGRGKKTKTVVEYRLGFRDSK